MPTFRKGKKKDEHTEEVKQGEDEPAKENVADESLNASQDTDHQPSEVKHKKKKFSFSRKKKPSKSYSRDDVRKDSTGTTLVELAPGKVVVVERRDKNEGAPVRRAQSLLLPDDQPEKRRKFWKVHRSKSNKKAKSANVSGADYDTSSVVTNPDMDEWRMSGLLNSVEKSKLAAANASQNNESVGNGDSQTPATLLASSTPKKAPAKDDDEEEEADGKPTDAAVPTEQGAESKAITTTKKVPESEKFVETAGLDYEYASEMHVSFSAPGDAAVAPKPIEEEAMDEVRVQDAECAPTFDGGLFGATIYALDEKNSIVARDLCDVIRDGDIELDKAVDISDWLVLNLAKEDWIVVQCTVDDGDVVDLRDNSVEAV